MKQGKIIGLTSLIALSGIILVACGTKTSEQKNIKFSIPTDVASLDTTILTDQYSYDVAGNVEEGLTRVDSKGNAALALAKSIDVSKDGLTYTVTLRDNLKWSNGDIITANDFRFSWINVLNPSTKAEYVDFLYIIKGAEEYSRHKGKLADVGIKAVNNKTLEITLTRPAMYFPLLLAHPVFFPVSERLEHASNVKIRNNATVGELNQHKSYLV